LILESAAHDHLGISKNAVALRIETASAASAASISTCAGSTS
jgi:hypothetical protein